MVSEKVVILKMLTSSSDNSGYSETASVNVIKALYSIHIQIDIWFIWLSGVVAYRVILLWQRYRYW